MSPQGPSHPGTRDPHQATPTGKPRARSVGLKFRGTPGKHNAITDVPGVEVGYQTLIQADTVRTGVTAIHPRGKANPGDPVAAGYHSQNGNGEMTGVSWIEESGTCQGPIAITNTNAVGVAHAGIIAWLNRYHPELTDVWLLPVAAETWDGYLNDINGHHVTEDTVIAALQAATRDQPDEGSVIAVVVTDAPLFPSQCKAFARRVTSGLARTGTSGSHSSGDIFLALSTANPGGFSSGQDRDNARYDKLTFIPWGNLDPFFEAVVQATEEAVANALIANEDMIGRDGHRSPALPRPRLADILSRSAR